MKTNITTYGLVLTAMGVLFHAPSANALSFMEGTQFLEANTKMECNELGGSFMEWYEETYCTKMPAVTRADFLQKIMEAAESVSMQCRMAYNYADVDWSASYGNALQVASCRNIVGGNPDGTFKPEQEITYAEAAKIATLAFELPMTKEMHPTWYGGYIQTLSRLGAAPREDIQPSDVLTVTEMQMMINTLTAEDTTTQTEMPYIGLNVEQAQTLAAIYGVPFRVTMMDGQPLPATMDYRPGRINATVENDIVVDYNVEGSEEEIIEVMPITPDYVGLSVEQAMELAETNGVPFRVTMRDGEFLPITMDYRPGRINASVEGDIVVDYEVEGGEEEVLEIMPVSPDYIGLTVEQAMELADINEIPFRVVMIDGQMQPTTEDFRMGRINAIVENNFVVDYEVEGGGEEMMEVVPMEPDFIGLTVEEAIELAEINNVPFRVIEKDGRTQPTTRDFIQGRINATTKNNVVVKYEVEGGAQAAISSGEIMVVNVAPQTRDCMGVGPMECLVVDGLNWYDQIEGFEFEAGYNYELKIERFNRPEPVPADAGAYTYKLVEVISKTKAQ
ncbi:DUF4377 domain-containing protein [bacterium]|nr:DUF4377 domain-containing protein [bacterium]NCQ55358.1 DUF4377 domain-containing protein [Candidatus Parcubacteria bacterium]NCS96755.1 DUF4377 domain-containing protein [bacterium]